MSEVVWIALISAGAALATALLTQCLAILGAHIQARRSDKREALQWQRTEASRLRAYRSEQGRELWTLVLASRRNMEARIRYGSEASLPGVPAPSPADVAAQAYAVALFGLPDAAPAARDFYLASADLENHIAQETDLQTLHVLVALEAWSGAFGRLEQTLLDTPAPDAGRVCGAKKPEGD